jgi:hypothetical protein
MVIEPVTELLAMGTELDHMGSTNIDEGIAEAEADTDGGADDELAPPLPPASLMTSGPGMG